MKELPTPTIDLSPIALPRGLLHPSQNESPVDVKAKVIERGGISVTWAQHQDEVREAQRLRYDIFAGEMGARITSSIPEHDIDLFDDYCEHLIVRDQLSQVVVGTYRVLTPAQSKRLGGNYTDTEFDLTRLRGLREWSSLGEVVCIPITDKVRSSWHFGGPWLNSWFETTWTP